MLELFQSFTLHIHLTLDLQTCILDLNDICRYTVIYTRFLNYNTGDEINFDNHIIPLRKTSKIGDYSDGFCIFSREIRTLLNERAL